MRKTRRLEKSAYQEYLKKAEDFYNTMQVAASLKNWNSVGLEAVHCSISTVDSLLVFYGGIRSAADDHREYEARPFRQGDAEDIMLHVERFFCWAKTILPRS